jgi:hypothetical protein
LKDCIERPRDNNQSLKAGHTPQHDYYHLLYFTLKW